MGALRRLVTGTRASSVTFVLMSTRPRPLADMNRIAAAQELRPDGPASSRRTPERHLPHPCQLSRGDMQMTRRAWNQTRRRGVPRVARRSAAGGGRRSSLLRPDDLPSRVPTCGRSRSSETGWAVCGCSRSTPDIATPRHPTLALKRVLLRPSGRSRCVDPAIVIRDGAGPELCAGPG